MIVRKLVGTSLGFFLVFALGCKKSSPITAIPVRNGVWQWHSPYRGLSKGLAVEEVYFRAATISYDGERYVPILIGRYAKVDPKGVDTPVHLTFNFDGGAVRHFEEVSVEEIAKVLADAFRKAKKLAESKGHKVEGIQLDIDCPTRLLPRYAGLIRALRPQVSKGTQVSVTGLTSWLNDGRLEELWSTVDVFVPQFYEGRLPQNFEDDVPVSEAGQIGRYVNRFASVGLPFRIGIAAYGQALLFDDQGKRFGIYRGLSLADAFRHPSLRLQSIRTVGHERHVRFLAIRSDRSGRGKGFGILYRIPTWESVREAIQEVKKVRSPNCGGYIIYRLPEDRENQTLGAAALAQVVAGERPQEDIELDFRRTQNPFALIEGQGRELSQVVLVAVKNRGNASRLEDAPVTVDVRFPAGCADTVSSLYADRIDRLNGEATRGNVSLSRADGVRISRWMIGAGERADLAEIRLNPGCRAAVNLVKK